MNKSFSKIRHIQETNKIFEKRILSEGFVSEYTKEQAIESFREADNGKGVVYFDPTLKKIIFEIGPRKFYIKELE